MIGFFKEILENITDTFKTLQAIIVGVATPPVETSINKNKNLLCQV